MYGVSDLDGQAYAGDACAWMAVDGREILKCSRPGLAAGSRSNEPKLLAKTKPPAVRFRSPHEAPNRSCDLVRNPGSLDERVPHCALRAASARKAALVGQSPPSRAKADAGYKFGYVSADEGWPC